MYNKVIMMGRITHDLELRTTPNGVSVCKFSVAVDRKFQPKGEEKKTDFFNVVAWRQAAEFVTRYFGKGRMILVEGELHNVSYNDKNGAEARTSEILADRLSFTGEKAQNDGGAAYSQPAASTANSAPAEPVTDYGAEGEYPF